MSTIAALVTLVVVTAIYFGIATYLMGAKLAELAVRVLRIERKLGLDTEPEREDREP